jgi:hypothetical protein
MTEDHFERNEEKRDYLLKHVERAILVANDPVVAAIYYNTAVDAFIQFLMVVKSHATRHHHHLTFLDLFPHA